MFGFGGQAGYYTDAETGLVLCTNRFYDPQSGRFLTRDPLGYAGGINLYSYTQNNPVNRMDPSGLYVDDNYHGGFGKPEDGVPTIGPIGASVNSNVAEAEATRDALYAAGEHRGLDDNPFQGVISTHMNTYSWYTQQVATGHRWDYKNFPQRTHSDIPPGGHWGKYLFDHYGNFNAGAVAAALGLSKKEAVVGADVAHVLDHIRHPATDKEDDGDEWIVKGYDWYMKTHDCKK